MRDKVNTCIGDVNFDLNKALEKINHYKKPTVPNFNLMTSRPSTDSVLPSYMQGINSKQSCGMITDKTLKMNNFSEGKFSQSSTSFWPKKSFNKIINLNLLNATKLLQNNTENSEMNDYIKKSMKFYSKLTFNIILSDKNFDDLMKESMLTKFDSVTFKTIKR